MRLPAARRVIWASFAAAAVVFCVVQDRITADGARRYVALQREAIAGRRPAVAIDEVMAPAVERSFRQALVYSGAVAAAGLTLALATRRR